LRQANCLATTAPINLSLAPFAPLLTPYLSLFSGGYALSLANKKEGTNNTPTTDTGI
jgi:hypothetical protein